MDLMEAIKSRHSVRAYTDRKIADEVQAKLAQMIDECNGESGLHIQLCTDEPRAFSGILARYGKFKNVSNYIALVGPKDASLEERCGYYGEKIVLSAQQLGLNSCWVAATYSKGKTAAVVNPGEKLLMVIALGYGQSQGVAHRGKSISDVCSVAGEMPDWFRLGIEAALLAPTAINQQKFSFGLSGDKVSLRAGSGIYTKTDLGIVKYHFEIGAADAHWQWA